MLHRQFGCSNQSVSVIGQGTWRIEKADRASAIAALRRGIDMGMTHIDTAERYSFGVVEEIVASAIEGRRNEVFLTSKVLPENASRSSMRVSCENSLRRLRTDRLDCYLLHWRGDLPLEDTVLTFEELKQEGKIASWGLSNFDTPDLEEVASITDVNKIACNQILYHLNERGSEHTVIPWCLERGIAITAYSTFGHQGFPSPASRGGSILYEVARNHSATAWQVALAFLVRSPPIFAIPRSANPLHTAENARAMELNLSVEEISLIDTAFPRGPRPSTLPSI